VSDDQKVPTITIRVIDRMNFTVETALEDIPGGPDYALNMLATATRVVEQTKQDQEAIQFQAQMQAAASAHQAMLKVPKIKM
jgi:hypothetical protein